MLSRLSHRLYSGLLFLIVLFPISALAQLEEVVVTATKRGDVVLQDLPFSVQALTAEQLEDVGAMDFDDYFRLIPGLAVFDQGPGDKRIILRGVNATGAGTVGLYLDEVIVTGENAQDGGGRQPDIKLFDIERVEVLKGPQGTTFGSSSLSGTIRYITRKPDLHERDIRLMAAVGDTEGADGLDSQVEFALGVPLIKDRLAIRFAGLGQDQEGYIDSQFDDGVNSNETTAGRVSMLFAPSDNLSINLMAMLQDVETDGPAYYNLVDASGNPLPEYQQADLSRNPFEDDLTIYNLTVEYAAAFGTVTGTASLYDRETVFNRDASLAVGPYSVITQPKDRELNSYELRFVSDWDGRFQTLVGAFAQNEDRFFQSRIFPSDPVTGEFTEVSGFSLDRHVTTEIDEVAFFAEGYYDVTDKLTLTAGLRWFDYDIEELAVAVQGFSGAPGGGAGPLLQFGENDVIGKLNLSYRSSDSVLLFAQWSQGFRSGGTNDQTAAQIANVVIPQGFGSDSLDNYEVGIKSEWLEGRLLANVSAYYMDWSDIQVQDFAQNPDDPVQFFPFRANGGAADIFGGELELLYTPTDNLDLGFVASWTDAELAEDNPDPSSGMDGDEIPYTPDFTYTLSADYHMPVLDGRYSGRFGFDVSHVGERNTELRPTNPLTLELDSYTLLNLRAGVEADSWEVMLTIDNVFDEDTVVDVFRIIPGLTPDGFIRLWPRKATLSVRKRF